jgi:trehalose 6-phosphate synthase
VSSADLLVVSNRGPLSFGFDEEGRPVSTGSAGGLAGTLHSIFEGSGATWVACAMSDADRAAAAEGLMNERGLKMVTVDPDPETYQMAYNVVSNATLWYAHHHLFDAPRRPKIDHRFVRAWEAYRDLNSLFADVVSNVAADSAVVLVQDYHLTLLPAMLAARRPDLAVVHFSHTPFADPNVLRMLPTAVVKELLEGMSGATSCGFHSTRWQSAFLACCRDAGVPAPATFVGALAPDAAYLAERVRSPGVAEAAKRLGDLVGDCSAIVKVDRVEPSKNLLRGFWAMDELLRTRPHLRGKVVLLALAYSSRQELGDYIAYGAEVELAARRVNDTWATADWSPVVLDVADDPDRSFAALTMYDVLLVNPLRDGLNLVAKEGPMVNTNDGAVALSTEAGAFDELAGPAIGLNPFDVSETASAIALGLEMPKEERMARAAELNRLATKRRPADWLADQLAAAAGKFDAGQSPRVLGSSSGSTGRARS